MLRHCRGRDPLLLPHSAGQSNRLDDIVRSLRSGRNKQAALVENAEMDDGEEGEKEVEEEAGRRKEGRSSIRRAGDVLEI